VLPLESAATTIAHTAEVIATSMAESKVDPELIAQTKQMLIDAADALTDNRFPIMGTIHDTSFGTDHAGLDLSKHHALAHEVMEETLKGVTKDVEEFCTNLIAAVKLFQTADSDAAADLKQRHDWLEQTQYESRHSHGDQAQQQAQQDVQEQTQAGDA
jgi:Na+/phosphate symporter